MLPLTLHSDQRVVLLPRCREVGVLQTTMSEPPFLNTVCSYIHLLGARDWPLLSAATIWVTTPCTGDTHTVHGWMKTRGFSSAGSGDLALKPVWIQVRGLSVNKTRGYESR